MIELYGKIYAPANATYLDHCPTINGTYRKRSYGLILTDRDGNERAFIRRDGFGPVSMTRLADGSRHYMMATSSIDETWLGTPKSYMAEVEGAKLLADKVYEVPA